jgi:hypothetical protein
LPTTHIDVAIAFPPLPSLSHAPIDSKLMFFISPMDGGGLGLSFAPPIQQTADSSNVARALSFNPFAFFATNADMPMTVLGIGPDGIAFATTAGAAMTAVGVATSAASMARTAQRFGQGVSRMVQYLPPLLEEVHAPYSQSEAEEEKAMMGGLCMLVVCVLRTPVVLLGSHP